MAKTLDGFERQHRALMFRAERAGDSGMVVYHRDAVEAAMVAMRAGERDATALWVTFPADPTPTDPGQPVDTGADYTPEDFRPDGSNDVDKIADGDDSTPQRFITVYSPDDEV